MDAKTILKGHHLKSTPQREAIVDVLQNLKTPVTIEQLAKEVKTPMDLSTLYRNLDIFEQNRIVIKTILQEPLQTVYELNRNLHKHHLICIKCHRIVVIEDCPLETYETQIANNTGYIIKRHQLDLYGICPECQV